MKCGDKWDIAVCSWSFQRNVGEIAAAMKEMGVQHIHLALAPALAGNGGDYLAEVKKQDWKITATMLSFDYEDYSTLETIKTTGGITPDDKWESSRALFERAVGLTVELGVPYITFHVGFLNHHDKAYAEKFYFRVRTLAEIARAAGVMFLLETGQETADDLLVFIETLAHPNVGLNFDPANLILYNTDEPLGAIRKLAKYVRHVHIKDAVRTKVKGEWGSEVPWGDGDVNPFVFLNELAAAGYTGAISVEREAGFQRTKDIALAVRRLRAY